jgi:uncharacterized protein (TIGR00369 family)
MTTYQPGTPDYDARVRRVFAGQPAMATIGAKIVSVAPGEVVVELPIAPHICQQHGFVHAGIVTAAVDTACGAAAVTLFPAGAGVLTVEFKVNLLAPAAGEKLVATGRVKRAGKQITFCVGEVEAVAGDKRRPVAYMTATMMTIEGRAGISD